MFTVLFLFFFSFFLPPFRVVLFFGHRTIRRNIVKKDSAQFVSLVYFFSFFSFPFAPILDWASARVVQ